MQKSYSATITGETHNKCNLFIQCWSFQYLNYIGFFSFVLLGQKIKFLHLFKKKKQPTDLIVHCPPPHPPGSQVQFDLGHSLLPSPMPDLLHLLPGKEGLTESDPWPSWKLNYQECSTEEHVCVRSSSPHAVCFQGALKSFTTQPSAF